MDADDECEEWMGWLDLPPKRVIRARGRVVSIRPGYACAADIPPQPLHAPPDGYEWAVITREEGLALLAEGKRIADERRKAREKRERDPERAR